MSTALAALLAIALFGETSNLAVRFAGTAVITLGTYLMIEKRQGVAAAENPQDRTWLIYTVLSAAFAALASELAKMGIESNLATAVRACVVLVMAWAIVIGKDKLAQAVRVGKDELGFLVASGLATGASWLLYYHAIAAGQVSVVVQVDKLSTLVSVIFARFAFKERLSRRELAGLVLIVLDTAALTIWK